MNVKKRFVLPAIGIAAIVAACGSGEALPKGQQITSDPGNVLERVVRLHKVGYAVFQLNSQLVFIYSKESDEERCELSKPLKPFDLESSYYDNAIGAQNFVLFDDNCDGSVEWVWGSDPNNFAHIDNARALGVLGWDSESVQDTYVMALRNMGVLERLN